MAKASSKTTMFLNVALLFVLLLAVSMAEGRSFLGVLLTAKEAVINSGPTCDEVVGVESGDTCFAIAQAFNLTNDFFNSINPNVNCTALFVGQWICVDGSAN
ncbi:Chitinase [Bertholletia excelsa]